MLQTPAAKSRVERRRPPQLRVPPRQHRDRGGRRLDALDHHRLRLHAASMSGKLTGFLRSNLIALVALFIALGGTSCAATS